MHLCLVVMMADMNYLSNKILKQKLKSLHKTVEASVWIHNPKQHFQTEFGVVVRRILGTGVLPFMWSLLWQPGKVVLSTLHTFQGRILTPGCGSWDMVGVVWGWWRDWVIWEVPASLADPGICWFWDSFPSAWVLADGSWALQWHWGFWWYLKGIDFGQLHALWENSCWEWGPSGDWVHSPCSNWDGKGAASTRNPVLRGLGVQMARETLNIA